MLGIEELDLAMLIADADMLEAAISDLMGRSQIQDLMNSNRNLKTMIQGQIERWKGKMESQVSQQLEDQNLLDELALYQQVVQYSEDEFFEQLDEIQQSFQTNYVFYQDAKRLFEQEQANKNPMLPHYFCQQWHQRLIEEVERVQAQVVNQQKDQHLESLYQQMESMQQISQMSPLEDTGPILGRLWDMSAASLSTQDLKTMQSQADFLKKNPKLLDIAQSLGRSHQSEEDEAEDAFEVEPEYQEAISEMALDDITGVTQGDDLNKLLPNETLFLTYPELEVVFYQHLVDKRLQNYHMKGKNQKRQPIFSDQSHQGELEEEQGPFIICLDASGSMRGFAEQCAKALSFALMQIALAQSRDCYVILFSSDQITYELTKKDGLREMSDFLSYTFHGGTDLEQAMQAAIDAMVDDKFSAADLVVISDFIAPKHSKVMREQVGQLKLRKNKFHAICLSNYGNPQVLDIFDYQWDYFGTLMQKMN